MRRRGGVSLGILLGLSLVCGRAHAGACPDDQDAAFLEVAGGQVLQVGRPARVRLGLDHLASSGWPDCDWQRSARPATVRLEWARAAGGRGERIAEGTRREIEWTPRQAGIGWLRVTARDAAGQSYEDATPVLVAQGEVRLAVGRGQRVSALLWLPGDPRAGLRLSPQVDAGGTIALPRAPAFWRITGRKLDGWAEVRADGTASLVPATARIELGLDAAVREGWQIGVDAPGVPPLVQRCDEACVVAGLPPGEVRLRLRPLPDGPESTIRATAAAGKGVRRRMVSLMHALAGLAQPTSGPGRFLDLPGVKAAGGPEDAARPFDGPAAVTTWLGSALCARAKDRAVGCVGVPRQLVRGAQTLPVVDGEWIAWAETRAEWPRRVVVLAARPGGLVAEALAGLPRDGECRAEAVAVSAAGTIFVGGGCGQEGARGRGFVAERRDGGWAIDWRPGVVTALVRRADEVLAIEDGARVLSCGPGTRCRSLARAPERLVGFLGRNGKPLAIAASGAGYAIDRRLRLTVAAPAWDLEVSRLVEGRARTVALFGPVITGSEYHPFCVRSVVAELVSQGWTAVHRVEGARGRRLDCQDDDANPVVVDVAVTGGGGIPPAPSSLFVRRRPRSATGPTGWTHLSTSRAMRNGLTGEPP